jgi:hypothetical protein
MTDCVSERSSVLPVASGQQNNNTRFFFFPTIQHPALMNTCNLFVRPKRQRYKRENHPCEFCRLPLACAMPSAAFARPS